VSFEDWIFALHLLSAATLVGSLVMSWIVVVALLMTDAADETLSLNRVATVGTAATGVGISLVIVFGIWLAILRDAFEVSDGWVLAAIALWAVAAVAISWSVVEYRKPVAQARALVAAGQRGPSAELVALNRTTTGLLLRSLASVAVLLIVVDMIWKPGA
jgi:hypothetical protein